LPVISLCGARRVVEGSSKSLFDAGPKEFLSLFANASFVCTNSFHGTVFSVNFEKEFLCFTEKMTSEKAVSSRVYSILDRLDLLSRICTADTEPAEFRLKTEKDMSPINYSEVNTLLQKEREISFKYLKEAVFR
ncbi:MAG: polysaccharide pyruvyl transferase family protein, partial [Clostridiales bacterium]|nr:polysaccharide pyruvyl transferase family protein [Clostridiales bacterium]